MSVYTFTDGFDTVYLPSGNPVASAFFVRFIPVLLKFLLIFSCSFSLPASLNVGIPQSSIFYPLLFPLYTLSLVRPLSKCPLPPKSNLFPNQNLAQNFVLICRHVHCLMDISIWVTKGNFKVNFSILNSLSFLPISVLIFFILTGDSSGHLFQFLISFHLELLQVSS